MHWSSSKVARTAGALALAAALVALAGCGDPTSETAPGANPAPRPGVESRAGEDRAAAPEPGGETAAALVRVVDGDTIVVRLSDGSEERVRYIGLDAPEAPRPGEPGEPLSAARLRSATRPYSRGEPIRRLGAMACASSSTEICVTTSGAFSPMSTPTG